MPEKKEPHIVVKDMTLAYGSNVVQRNVSFTVNRGDVFIIMGGSGCGKSTTMRGLTGLKPPSAGEILYDGIDFYGSIGAMDRIRRNLGVMFQSGALWSSMTLAENVALPLEQYTSLKASQIGKVVSLKLSLVGLSGFENYYPSQISGGMRKRVGVARAMSMDPEVLFFDEPSAGLDPVSARRLDDLILQLSDSLKTTMVVVTHELASIFAIASNSVFLDPETKTAIAHGDPKKLLAESSDPKVINFLTRGQGRETERA
jgi:phospholipid/cholesterol/gamma-HCH transport system ATP-binding protein